MDGWMDINKIDKQIDGWLNGHTFFFKDRLLVGWIGKPQKDGWMDRQMDGRMDIYKQMYGWMDMKKNRRMVGCIEKKQMDGWVEGRIKKQMDGWMDGYKINL